MIKSEILSLLQGQDDAWLFEAAHKTRIENLGDKVYLRGLIELSNICAKDCLYCGIRASNRSVKRYRLSRESVLESARIAMERNFGSVVIQAGEQTSNAFVDEVERLVRDIKKISKGALGITLSLGEQTRETYQRWFEAGAHRYLLRIESSSPDIYARIHPAGYSWQGRVEALRNLAQVGYRVGSGVMIGLPGQSVEDLADDLLFLKDFGINMCGMGPYIEHPDTPLSAERSGFSQYERVKLTFRMIAILRLLMPQINIAATTALETLDPKGRERAVNGGANILMPNIGELSQRGNYQLYSGKVTEDMALAPFNVGWGEWGDPILR